MKNGKIKINHINLIIIIFLISRIFYYMSGVRFEAQPKYWQILPLEFLKNDLTDSILYSFSQPPLLNIIYGISLKISNTPVNEAYLGNGNYLYILHLVYLFFGLVAFIHFYKISITFLKKKTSFLIILILMTMPLTVLWENHGYKDYLTMCFLVSSIYYSILVIKNYNFKIYLLLGIYLCLLCLLRETFHLFWVYVFIIFEYLSNKRIIKSLLLFSMVTLLVLPFYLKNFIIFDKFQIAGWLYENLTQKTLYVMEMQHGKHKKLKKIIFKNDNSYKNFINKLSSIRGNIFQSPKQGYIKQLNYQYKHKHLLLHTDTFHNEVMIEVDEIRKKDFFLFVKEYPQVFIFSIANAFTRHFFNSSENFFFIQENAQKIPVLVQLSHCIKITLLCFGKTDLPNYSLMNYKQKIIFSLEQLNFLILFIYFFMFYQFIKFFLNRNKNSKEDNVFNFWTLTMFFMLLLLIIFEDTEIPRHRFPYEYLMLIFSLYFYKKNKEIGKPN